MRIYYDHFSNDELFTDVYPFTKRFNDTVIAIKSKKVAKGSDAIAIASDDVIEDDNTETVIDLIDRFNYNPIKGMKKMEFVKMIKAYIARVLKYLPECGKEDRVADFKKGIAEAMNFIVKNEEMDFSDFDVYCGSSFDDNCQYFVSYYDGEDETPTFLFFADGMRDEKC